MDSLFYRYKPLQQGEIRLVRVADMFLSSPLIVQPSIDISHTTLDQAAGTYEALSYSWGSPTDNKGPVVCSDGTFLLVGPGLLSALVALLVAQQKRNDTARGSNDGKPKENEPLVFWIDAICINQADNAEKSSQVGMMRDIYRSAIRTVAYLGEPADDSDLAATFMKFAVHKALAVYRTMLKTEDLAGRVRRKFSMARSQPVESEFMQTMMDAEKSLILIEAFQAVSTSDESLFGENVAVAKPLILKAVGALISRPYFQRSWTIQELAVAKDTIMYCGADEVDLQEIGAIVSEMLRVADINWDEYVEECRLFDFYRGAAGLVTMHGMRNEKRDGKGHGGLFKLLKRFRSAKATLAVDKVYAFLGLCAAGMPVDYSKSKADLYVETAKYQISMRGMGDLLYEAARSEFNGGLGGGLGVERLPSWVPDWEEFPIRPSLGETFSRTARWFFDASGSERRYGERESQERQRRKPGTGAMARSPEREDVPFEFRGNTLVLRGIGSQKIWIVGKAAPAAEKTSTRANAAHLANVIRDMCMYRERLLLSGKGYPTGEDVDAVLATTLVMDQSASLTEERGVRGLLYRIDRGELMELIKRFPEQQSKAVRRFASGIYRGDSVEIENMVKSTVGRRLAVTSESFLALVPSGAVPGDEIHVVAGAKVPFVLRRERVGGERVLVGDCYVHGIMLGEMVRDDDGLPETTEVRIV